MTNSELDRRQVSSDFDSHVSMFCELNNLDIVLKDKRNPSKEKKRCIQP